MKKLELILLLVLLALFPLISSQAITFDRLEINDSIVICNDAQSVISILALDNNSNSVSLDTIELTTSINITGSLFRSPNGSIYTLIINNITEKGDILTLKIKGNQSNKIIEKNVSLKIDNCINFKNKFSDRLDIWENFIRTNFLIILINLLVLFVLILFIVIIKKSA